MGDETQAGAGTPAEPRAVSCHWCHAQFHSLVLPEHDGSAGRCEGSGRCCPRAVAAPGAGTATSDVSTGLCPECGSPGSKPLKTRPDTVECATGCGTWVRPDADPAVTWALDFWQRKYRDAALAARTPQPDGGER